MLARILTWSRPGALPALLVLLMTAPAACGREVVGNVSQLSASLRLMGPRFQTSGNDEDDEVRAVRIVVWAGQGAARREIASEVVTFTDENEPDEEEGIEFKITFPLQGAGTVYEVTLAAATAQGDTLYRTQATQFTTEQLTAANGHVTLEQTAYYVGPGSQVARIVIAPRSRTLTANETFQFSVEAFDGANAPMSNARVEWRSLDPNIAFTEGDRSGVVRAAINARGTARIVAGAEGASGVKADTVLVQVVPGPSQLTLVSGGGQTGVTGRPLANPIVVRVLAFDGQPVAGATVLFGSPGGGPANPNSAVTNANGEAQTAWTLGNNAGGQTLNVNVQNSPAQLQVQATAGSPQIQKVSGDNQSAHVNATFAAPMFVRVLNSVNQQPVVGISVTFTAAGSSPVSIATDTQGLAGIIVTAPGTPSTSLPITATVTGTTQSVTFNVTVLP